MPCFTMTTKMNFYSLGKLQYVENSAGVPPPTP
jgi:hypothetical protein